VVMVTGGKMAKSLHFARWFWKAGYKVVMVETDKYWLVGSRWSRAVTRFETIPCPRTDPEGYVNGLIQVAQKHNADFFVPVSSPAAAVSDAAAKSKLEESGCKVLHFDLDTCMRLDNKHEFCEWVKQLELTAPASYNVPTEDAARALNKKLQEAAKRTPGDSDYSSSDSDGDTSPDEGSAPTTRNKVRFVLKNLEYDPIHRLDMFMLPCPEAKLEAYLAKVRRDGNAIEPEHPWQVQQFVKGTEYTSFAVLREGQLRALTTAESSPSQLNYEHVEIGDITAWMKKFAGKTKLTGQLCMDFIKDDISGVSYPIECNPRVHSQCVTFLDNKAFGDAVLADDFQKTLIPKQGTRPVYWLYNEIMKVLPDSIFNYGKASVLQLVGRLIFEKEADFDIEDPVPFLMRNHFQLPGLLFGTLLNGTPWKKIDFCIGKVVELNGD